MKTNLSAFILLLSATVLSALPAFSQKNKQKPLDSTLEANSDKWKVKLNKGFGLGKPEFGPYTTSGVEKTDSPVFRKRTKEGTYTGITISGEGWDWDFSKYETVEKAKAYNTTVAKGTDTAQLLFSIYRISKEKNLTFFGELMNKHEEGTNLTLGYKTNISGIIGTSYDTIPWRFLIEDTFSRDAEKAAFTTRATFGYLVSGIDSLYAEPIMSNYGSPGDKYFWQFQKGVFINNTKGDRLAALRFGMQGNLSDPFFVWIRKDAEPVKQHAIASFFTLMMIANMYSQTN